MSVYNWGRYGFSRETRDDGRVFEVGAIDLLGRGMDPRPLYSERRRMERMSPVRLGVHLIWRAIYYRLPNIRLTRAIWRITRG